MYNHFYHSEKFDGENIVGRFDFVQAKFPELAEYGNKAESFLNSDPATCGYHLSRVFESSIEIICGLNNVSTKGVDGKDRDKIEIIDELQNTGVIDSNIARTLTSMRRTRNKVAHNDNITSSEISAFFQDSLSVCSWLMQNVRGSVKSSTRPQSSRTVSQPSTKRQPAQTVRQTSTHDGLTISKIDEDYRRNSIVAEEKYEGKRITINGRILSVGKYYVLLDDGDGFDCVYCSFSQYDEYLLRELKSGQKFTVRGTFSRRGGSDYLNNCEVPPTPEERRMRELAWEEALREREKQERELENINWREFQYMDWHSKIYYMKWKWHSMKRKLHSIKFKWELKWDEIKWKWENVWAKPFLIIVILIFLYMVYK